MSPEPQYEITDDVKAEVLARTDLVALVGSVTTLKKAGTSWKGLCPFHGEKTPSFHVHPDKGFYYCFGCQAKGDAITFVRETEKMEFPEAVAYLARRAGVNLPVRRTGSRVDRAKETRGAEAIAAAAKFFREALPRHAVARKYLEGRGIAGEAVERLGFGAAPDGWDALRSALSGRFPEELLLEAGLLQRGETGRVYDRFRNRLTIEIRDGRGEVLGFGARALGDDNPKYLNSPEGPRFSKGRILYGLDLAREGIRRTDEVILVEGYFDRIAFDRAGAPQAVASMGTALTPAQADLLARQAPTVVVAYDGDAAGQAASLKAFSLLAERGVRIRHLVLAGGHDPDSFLAEKGPAALAGAVKAAPGLVEALAARVPPPSGDPEERAARIGEAKEVLGRFSDPVLRYEYATALARLVSVPVSVLASGGRGPASGKTASPSLAAGSPVPAGPLPEGEEKVLQLLVSCWPESRALVGRLPDDLFGHPVARELLGALKLVGAEAETLDFFAIGSHLGVAAEPVAARLLLAAVVSGDRGPIATELGRIHNPLKQLKIRWIERRMRDLQPAIAEAERLGNAEEREELLRRKQGMSAEVRTLKSELRATGEPAGRE